MVFNLNAHMCKLFDGLIIIIMPFCFVFPLIAWDCSIENIKLGILPNNLKLSLAYQSNVVSHNFIIMGTLFHVTAQVWWFVELSRLSWNLLLDLQDFS